MAVTAEEIDGTAPRIGREMAGRTERIFQGATAVLLVLFAIAAPHSIAVTQAAFYLGLLVWVGRMIVARRSLVVSTPIDVALAAFVLWTAISVLAGLDPLYSVTRLRGVFLFLILYFVAANVRSIRFAWTLALILMVSSLGNLAWTYAERYRGHGLEVTAIADTSPLKKWELQPGDVIVTVDGTKVEDLEAVNRAFEAGNPRRMVAIRYVRDQSDREVQYRANRVIKMGTTVDRLGLEVSPGRVFRSRGFFSHPATYAEVLQVIGALAFAWVLMASRRRPRWALGIGALLVLVVGAIVQTETRAPIVAICIAAVGMVVLLRPNWRVWLAVALSAGLVLAIGGALVMKGRGIGFLDARDGSTSWRLTVWREGLDLIAENPLLGIGPDAAKTQRERLEIFDKGRLPPGHFHSTPLQLAVDRGLPALLAWGALVVIFLVSSGRNVRRLVARDDVDWRATATLLGVFGAFLGFISSSLVHYNWGDSEPMQLVWFLMGIAFAIVHLSTESPERREP